MTRPPTTTDHRTRSTPLRENSGKASGRIRNGPGNRRRTSGSGRGRTEPPVSAHIEPVDDTTLIIGSPQMSRGPRGTEHPSAGLATSNRLPGRGGASHSNGQRLLVIGSAVPIGSAGAPFFDVLQPRGPAESGRPEWVKPRGPGAPRSMLRTS